MRTKNANHYNQLGLKFKNMYDIVIDGYDLTLVTKNLTIPKLSTEQVEVKHGNSTIFIAGRTNPDGTLPITFRDVLEADVVATLLSWRNKVYNPTTQATGKPSEYKTNATIYRYDNTGDKIVEKWNVIGLFPLSVDLGEGDYESGDPCELAVEFSYDNIVRDDQANVKPVMVKA